MIIILLCHYYFPTDGSDYTDFGLINVTLSASMSQVTIPFPLIDDDVFEITEQLVANLSFGAGGGPDRVSIDPEFAEISILDDDGKLESDYIIM